MRTFPADLVCFVGSSFGGILGIKKLLILVACRRGTLAGAVEFVSELDKEDGVGLKDHGVGELLDSSLSGCVHRLGLYKASPVLSARVSGWNDENLSSFGLIADLLKGHIPVTLKLAMILGGILLCAKIWKISHKIQLG